MWRKQVCIERDLRLSVAVIGDDHEISSSSTCSSSCRVLVCTVTAICDNRAAADIEATSFPFYRGSTSVWSVSPCLIQLRAGTWVANSLSLLAAALLRATATDSWHFLAALDYFLRITFLKCCQTIKGLVLNCICPQKVLVSVLFEVFYLRNVRIVLVVDIVSHEVHALKSALNLTQVHFVDFQITTDSLCLLTYNSNSNSLKILKIYLKNYLKMT